jgi:hypothetical protein
MPQIRKVTSKNIVFDVINDSSDFEQVDLINGAIQKNKNNRWTAQINLTLITANRKNSI